MTLDLLCLALLATAAVSGAATGLLRQLAKLAAAGIALAGARAAAPGVADVLARWTPRFVAGPAAAALSFVVLYLLLGVLLGLAARAARAAGAVPPAADRGLGALLGGAKGALVVWVLVSALVAWGRPLPVVGARLGAAASDFAAFATEHNALGLVRARDPAPRTARERREAAAAQWNGAAYRAEDR